ncbi:MAG: FtsX-like permease family protein, partial [Gemmatimonadales bacterium]
LSFQEQPWWQTLALVVRSANDPVAYAASIQRAIWSLDPTVPLEIAPLRSQVRSARAEPILVERLLLLFGGLALLLGVVGVYGVTSNVVTQRRSELGIRLALGARAGTVVGRELGRMAGAALAGLLAGLVLTTLARRLYAGMLYGISPSDPATLSLVPVGLLLVALLAASGPARRAGKVDPMRVLRGGADSAG